MSTPHYNEISVFHTLPQPRLHLADIAQHAGSEPMTASRIRGARFASCAAEKSASRQITEIAPAQNRAVEAAARAAGLPQFLLAVRCYRLSAFLHGSRIADYCYLAPRRIASLRPHLQGATLKPVAA